MLTYKVLVVRNYSSNPEGRRLRWQNMLGYSATVTGYFCNGSQSESMPYKGIVNALLGVRGSICWSIDCPRVLCLTLFAKLSAISWQRVREPLSLRWRRMNKCKPTLMSLHALLPHRCIILLPPYHHVTLSLLGTSSLSCCPIYTCNLVVFLLTIGSTSPQIWELDVVRRSGI
jgi:hypothetical protein